MLQIVLSEGKLIPKAVIAVDLFGQPADFLEIRKITEKYNLLLLEDGAQGFGGKIRNKRACSFGDIGTTSFFPAKPLGCYGDGGAIFTDCDEWEELIRSYKVHGKGKDKYDNVRIGMNSRLDTLQAAILLEKIKLLDNELMQCNAIAYEYTENLKDVVKVPVINAGMESAWAQYTICVKDSIEREKIIQKLAENEIPSAVYYKKPMHQQEAFSRYQIKKLNYPVTEHICQCCLSLPMHAYIKKEEVNKVCNILRRL